MRRLVSTALLLWAMSVSFGCDSDSGTTQIMGPGAVPADLRTLVDVTTGLDITSGETGTFNWVGQSFVVPESGSFGDLRFNFYTFRKAPVAFGSLFLLTQEYLGVPGALSAATPGFVARSERRRQAAGRLGECSSRRPPACSSTPTSGFRRAHADAARTKRKAQALDSPGPAPFRWRRGRDSNPRAGYPARRFRGAPVTTTSVPLLI